jgi:hypothetical protein
MLRPVLGCSENTLWLPVSPWYYSEKAVRHATSSWKVNTLVSDVNEIGVFAVS